MTVATSRLQAPARPVISPARYGERLARARAGLAERGAAGLLIGVGADLRYLTGYNAMTTERLTMLVLGASGQPVLVAPRLEAMGAAGCPAAAAGLVRVEAWDETDDPYRLVAGDLAAAAGDEPRDDRLLVSATLWALHVLRLQEALPGRAFGPATEVLRAPRMQKDAEEIELLRLAAHAADRVVAQIAAGRLVGRTEADVALEVRDRLVAEGHEAAAFAIVASGPNSASPHHMAGDRVIEPGDPLVLDIGGTLGGYYSDITRTLWVTGGDPAMAPEAAFLRIFDLTQRAQAAAIAAVRPSVACERLDEVARTIIAESGHGPEFIHRLGHGIGLEGHEEPYLVAGNGETLAPGVAFSVEPGIYQAGRYGVRIEDIVVCGDAGPDVLNEASRDLWVVAG
ncbi:MAG TPA: Xaa-Pro peptidase family protein [Candidatus Eisenbacteria bacterium]|nr:Xaa-Pro peptidase family protein [Candidatus Eisenbacteria bacterium]